MRYASRCDRPDVIAVRVGLLGRLLLILPVEEVAEILPRAERIVLHRSPRPTATERLQNLRGHVQLGGVSRAANSDVEGVAAGTMREAEVKAVIERLTRLVGLRLGRGGERKMTPDVEASAEPSAEEPSAEEQAGEEPAEEAPAETAAQAASAGESAAEEAPMEKQSGGEQTTA